MSKTFRVILFVVGTFLIITGVSNLIRLVKELDYLKTYKQITTESVYPQTFDIKCINCDNITDSIIAREADAWDTSYFVTSVPKEFKLDRAYYVKIPNWPFYKLIVYNKVKIKQ